MSRRGGTWTVRCTWPEGCRETGFYEYDSQREFRELYARYLETYRCVRHTNPEKNLTLDHPAATVVLVCTAVTGHDGRELRRTWRAAGATSGSGFDRSSAHKAYAKDWPVGTRLIISAVIEAPDHIETTDARSQP